jgi:predicted dehydrogenase
MNIAFIGCGYVADFYVESLRYHPELSLVGVYDRDEERLVRFSDHYGLRRFGSRREVLADSSIELIVNLTNPREHFAINREALISGKHVYSEKPLAMTYAEAIELASIAKDRRLYLGAAPCSLLGETAQTIWRALRDIAPVRLVYGNFDAQMNRGSRPWLWRSASGAPWPAKDEFEVGCTYEHAGYILTWLAAFFGPARRVTSFTACLSPNKGVNVDTMAPDFSVGCIEYDRGVVARLTCSLIAPSDRSLTIIGEGGTLYTKDVRDDASPVYISPAPASRVESALAYRFDHWSNKVERIVNRVPFAWGRHWRFRHRYPFVRKPLIRTSAAYKATDFCRGPAEMAYAIAQGRPNRLSAELGCHVTELLEILQYPERFTGRREIRSTFDPIEPL